MPTQTDIASGDGRPSPSEFRFVLAGLMLALALASLDQNIVATALPRITSELGGLQRLSWVVTAFVVTSTISAPLYGRLSDLYGRKLAYAVSIAVFLLGSILCGVADGMDALIAFRALQGLGAGGLIVLAQTVIGDLVSPRERGRYQGLASAVFATCSVAGPLLGGFLTQYATWRWIFYVNLPIGATAFGLIMVWLRPIPIQSAPHLDIAGAALLSAGTCCLLLMLSWGGAAYPWLSLPVIALGAGSAAAFFLLTRVEMRAPMPIMPPAFFMNRVFVVGVTVIGLASMALFAAAVFLPLMFQLLMGATPAKAGLMVAPMMAGVITASFGGGWMVTRTGRYKLFPVIGLLAASLSYAALSWATRRDTSAPPIEAILVVMGLGIGFVMPNLTTAIQNAVDRSEIGAATSTAAYFRSLGGALGIALSGAVLAAHLGHLPANLRTVGSGASKVAGLPQAQEIVMLAAYRSGLSGAFAVGTVIAALGFATVLFLPERPLRRATADVD